MKRNKFKSFFLSIPFFAIILIVAVAGFQHYYNHSNYEKILNLEQTQDPAILSNNFQIIRIGVRHTDTNQAGSIVDINRYGELSLTLFIPQELTTNVDFLKEYQSLMDSLEKFLYSDGFTVENFFKEAPKFQLGLDESLKHYGNYEIITIDSTPKFVLGQNIQFITTNSKKDKQLSFNLNNTKN